METSHETLRPQEEPIDIDAYVKKLNGPESMKHLEELFRAEIYTHEQQAQILEAFERTWPRRIRAYIRNLLG